MPYTALPDRRMPWDNDGTVAYVGDLSNGVTSLYTSGHMVELNDHDYLVQGTISIGNPGAAFFFFPESREVTACYIRAQNDNGSGLLGIATVYGSSDSTNGLDGTWETATLSGGVPAGPPGSNVFTWRSGIKPVSFAGAKTAVRAVGESGVRYFTIIHWYGEKAAGQTPDDIIFIDHDTTPGVEFQTPEDFGDQALGTTVVRQFRIKNTSATKTANTINIQCNDTDFSISTDGSTWVVTINLASLAAGAESPTYYVRCVTPAVGALLGPRHARIITTVASYT